MAIPSAAKRASKKADKIHEEVYGKKEPAVKPKIEVVDTKPPAASEAPVDSPASPDKVETTQVAPDPAPEVTGATNTENVGGQPAEASAEPSPVIDPNDGSWQHKYKVLQGMYNAEVPRMTKQIRDLTTEMETIKTAPAPVATTAASLINDKERDEYGAELIDIMKRAAREEFLPELERLKNENTSLKNSVGNITETATESARANVYTRLTDEVPNWQQLNSDQNFITWLQDIDIYSGQTRNTMLQQAFERNDALRVLAFFKGYLNEATATTPSTIAPAPVATAPAKVPVDSLVAPGTPRSTSSPAPATQGNTQIWTQAQISAFYRDVQKGNFKGREAEKTKIERDIVAAVSSGRVPG